MYIGAVVRRCVFYVDHSVVYIHILSPSEGPRQYAIYASITCITNNNYSNSVEIRTDHPRSVRITSH